MNLFLIDDDDSVADSMCVLGDILKLSVQAYSSAEQFLERGRLEAQGCLVVDLNLPGMSGLDLLERLEQMSCIMQRIVTSGRIDVPQAVRAMQLGAETVLEKPFGLNTLVSSVQKAIAKSEAQHQTLCIRADARKRLATLTDREVEVLNLIVCGLSNKQIAGQLSLTLRAIEDRRARLMRRLEVRSLAELLNLVSLSKAS